MMKMSKMQRGKGKKDMMVYFSLALIYPHDNVSHLIYNKTENENDHLTQWLLQSQTKSAFPNYFTIHSI